jgi:hypothetical protein
MKYPAIIINLPGTLSYFSYFRSEQSTIIIRNIKPAVKEARCMWEKIVRNIKSKHIVITFFALAAIYIGITLFAPVDEKSVNRYNLSATEIKALSLTVIVPYILIWSAAAYGYWRLKVYADKISKSNDGTALRSIADGLLLLALWLPISAILSSGSRRLYRDDPNLIEPSIIITNYTNVIIAFFAFYLIYKGASKLPNVLKQLNIGFNRQTIFWPLYAAIGAIFTYFTLRNPARQHPTEQVSIATYYLPDWLLITTIIIPSLVILYFGLRAVAYILNYTLKIPGIIYRKALRSIAMGIYIAVVSMIAIRMLSSFTPWFQEQNLKIVLGIIYLLLLFIGAGYLFIARGARKLQKIEEVK